MQTPFPLFFQFYERLHPSMDCSSINNNFSHSIHHHHSFGLHLVESSATVEQTTDTPPDLNFHHHSTSTTGDMYCGSSKQMDMSHTPSSSLLAASPGRHFYLTHDTTGLDISAATTTASTTNTTTTTPNSIAIASGNIDHDNNNNTPDSPQCPSLTWLDHMSPIPAAQHQPRPSTDQVYPQCGASSYIGPPYRDPPPPQPPPTVTTISSAITNTDSERWFPSVDSTTATNNMYCPSIAEFNMKTDDASGSVETAGMLEACHIPPRPPQQEAVLCERLQQYSSPETATSEGPSVSVAKRDKTTGRFKQQQAGVEQQHQQQQQQTLSSDKRCKVCGDRAVNHNFAQLTCESCKAFFRRNAHKVSPVCFCWSC